RRARARRRGARAPRAAADGSRSGRRRGARCAAGFRRRSAKAAARRSDIVLRVKKGLAGRSLAAPRKHTLVYKPVYIQRLLPNLYRDSVSLMELSASLGKLPGVEQASAVMATPGNLDFLRAAGLLDGKVAARPNDLLVAVRGRSNAALEAALAAALSALDKQPAPLAAGGVAQMPLRSLQMALAQQSEANLALISVPGDYAAAEATKALRLGLNVMLFSDNVALEDEIALKRYAKERNLLVMGPDCGTAIIDGVPL